MDRQTLTQRCVELRKQQGKTQQQVAADIGISRATLNAFENGRAGDFGIKKLFKLLDYYGYELCLEVKSPFPTLEALLREQSVTSFD